ncbi:hypothetical protein niasHT_024968 [Heterodera trifolii]|uniref:Fido domain-containing protein n=1 Tax=Heterodera trifolii TaxID=157864 RepID=A0ABD2JAJ6_9BILA
MPTQNGKPKQLRYCENSYTSGTTGWVNSFKEAVVSTKGESKECKKSQQQHQKSALLAICYLDKFSTQTLAIRRRKMVAFWMEKRVLMPVPPTLMKTNAVSDWPPSAHCSQQLANTRANTAPPPPTKVSPPQGTNRQTTTAQCVPHSMPVLGPPFHRFCLRLTVANYPAQLVDEAARLTQLLSKLMAQNGRVTQMKRITKRGTTTTTSNRWVSMLLNLHKHIMWTTNPLVAGLIRSTDVEVCGHIACPYEEVPEKLMEFLDWFNSHENTTDIIALTAEAHYRLVIPTPTRLTLSLSLICMPTSYRMQS